MDDDERAALLAAFGEAVATNQVLFALVGTLLRKSTLSREEVSGIYDLSLAALEAMQKKMPDAFYEAVWRAARRRVERQLRDQLRLRS